LQLASQLQQIDAAIGEIDYQMSISLRTVPEPSRLIDQVVSVSLALNEAREANQSFDNAIEIKGTVKRLKSELTAEKMKVLSIVEGSVNDGMRRIVDTIFGMERKSPHIELREKSYSFAVHDDTGTGTAYASLVILDLTVFLSTPLPVIAHDSLLYKNIENDSVAGLLKVYLTTTKQSFIAIDEIGKYGMEAEGILRERCVIQLDDKNVLYTKDWRR
jgi:hypothetical protein